jgi:hypothetical protein
MAAKKLLILLVIASSIVAEDVVNCTKITDEKLGTEYLEQVDREMGKWNAIMAFAEWDFETNITDENEHRVVRINFILLLDF